MADNDQSNDEYHFDDLDALNPESMDSAHDGEGNEKVDDGFQTKPQNNVKRNALIVIAVLLVIMVIYKIIDSFFSEDKIPKAKVASIKPLQKTTQSFESQQVVTSQTSEPIVNTNLNQETDSSMMQKLASLEQSQQNMRTDIVTINQQIIAINNNLQALMTRMGELNQVIEKLSARVEEQSQVIEKVKVTARQKVIHTAVKMPMEPPPKFYIQAVIPGRAWLIATNGATLTVREGTLVRGYGIVKLIDPIQGRVMTSSGQVIRFSQEDS